MLKINSSMWIFTCLLFFSTFSFCKVENDYNTIKPWKLLQDFYGTNFSSKIKFEFKDFTDGNSKFNCSTQTIFVNKRVTDKEKLDSIIAHEGSHIVLCGWTDQYNLEEESRFWDEGFATIFEYRLLGKELEYKNRTFVLANKQLKLRNLHFENIKLWHLYSKDKSGKINGYAYAIGSNFVYFLIDNYGEDLFKSFLKSMAKSKSFDSSVRLIYQKTSSELLVQWTSYIENHHEK